MKSTATPEVLIGYVFSGYLTFQQPNKSHRIRLNGYDLLIAEASQSEFDNSNHVGTTDSLLNKEQSVQKGYLYIKAPMELQLKLSDGSFFTLKKEVFDEQFQGYSFVHFDLNRNMYVVWENWLEAGHPIMVNASNGKITTIVGTSFSTNQDETLTANYASDIGAGWTPNGIQLFETQKKGVVKELFKFDPRDASGEVWGPIDLKWNEDASILMKCIMNNADSGYFTIYKKIQFKKIHSDK